MKANGACLAGGTPPGQDCWTVTEHAAVVLDGASSFTPSVADATQYVTTLAEALAQRLPILDSAIPDVLRDAIGVTVTELDLTSESTPSSTVVIARERSSTLEVFVLGDSTAVVQTTDGQLHRITDSRLSEVAPHLRTEYRLRLSEGSGYDERHRALLGDLQREEERVRNRPDGYWIAAADEHAAEHGVTASFPLESVEFCVLSTDGAQRVIDHLDIDWQDVVRQAPDSLDSFLERLRRWEETVDPNGVRLPRSKRHDDKTLVVCRCHKESER